MPPVSKAELYAAIRRDARAGMPARAIEHKYRVGRRTIIKALSSAWPEPRKKPPRRPSKLDPFKLAIDEILRADLDAPRKQRHTVTRIYDRLIAGTEWPMCPARCNGVTLPRQHAQDRRHAVRCDRRPWDGLGCR